jgi:hypothetical protein
MIYWASGDDMKFCYIDESGTGEEPYALMVGIIVDTQRMSLTKQHWKGLLAALSEVVGRLISEIRLQRECTVPMYILDKS